MKLKDGFVLRKMPDANIILPAGQNIREYRNAVILNDTAAFIYEALQKGEDPTAALLREYEIDTDTAESAVKRTITDLRDAGLIEES